MAGTGEAAVTVDVRQAPGELVVKLAGELDLTNAGVLEAKMAPFLSAPGVDVVTFDMAGLGFMDSSAIAVLLVVAASGRTVRLRQPSVVVHEVVTAMGLADVLQVEQ